MQYYKCYHLLIETWEYYINLKSYHQGPLEILLQIHQNFEYNKLKFYPELRLYKVPETITSEADIKTDLFSDNLVVVNYLKDTDYLNIRYQKKPFMLLIWFSALLLGIGGFLGLRKNS